MYRPWHTILEVRSFSLRTSLTTLQCARRIHAVTSPIWGLHAVNKDFIGDVTTESIRVVPRFIPANIACAGLFVPEDDGTVLAYQTRIDPVLLHLSAIALLLLATGLATRFIPNLPLPLPSGTYAELSSLLLLLGGLFSLFPSIGLMLFFSRRDQSEYILHAYLQKLLNI
jgi:hypothetical protein